MKKVLLVCFAALLIFSMVGCQTNQTTAAVEDESPAEEAAEPAEAEEADAGEAVAEAPDFSQNVNVDRASDYAKMELVLPVTGIGTGISTDVVADGDYTIVVMTKNSTNPYMNGMWKGGQKAGEDMGVEVVTLAPAQQDSIEEQLAIMEAQIQQGVDAFVIHPSDSNGIMPAVNAANEAGVPVISIGTASTSGSMMRTGVDYYETGVVVTNYLCEMAADNPGGVIILEGPPGAQNAEERKAGVLAALETYPDFYLIESQPANFNRAQGMQVMENLLQREGVVDELKIVIAANDEMALGAIQALKAAGITDVLVGGFDGSKDAAQAIKDGDLTVTYNTDPFGSTYLAVAYLVEYLNDGSVPEEYFIPFPSERHDPLITSDNIDEYVENFAWFN